MRFFLFFLCATLVNTAIPTVQSAQKQPSFNAPLASDILSRVSKSHPRIVLSDARIKELKKEIRTDEYLKKAFENLKHDGESLLRLPPSEYEIPDGKRLLSVSRRTCDRVSKLCLLYRLDGDRRWAERAWRELEKVAGYKDWNPSHFLDTAEMTAAVAYGYDWLYEYWTPSRRKILREAIVRHGLKPGLDCYRGKTRYGWWVRSQHNWNQVCNGGLTLGALAIAQEQPQISGEILANAIKSVPKAMQHFAPDGAWAEGPGYWSYATKYNVLMVAALDSALGTDFGLSDIPGFSLAGKFPAAMQGPSGLSFNYADARAGTIRAPQLFWFSGRFNEPGFADYQRGVSRSNAFNLIWYDPRSTADTPMPLDSYFRGSEVVAMRSAWGDRDALFVAFKAGDNSVNHSNLDIGSFVLESQGIRWVIDLGSDNYNLPAYFGKNRWKFYRLRAEGHNTIVINPDEQPDQNPAAKASVTRFDANNKSPVARANLSPAYIRQKADVQRTISMPDRKAVVISDVIRTEKLSGIWWFAHTKAKVVIAKDGRSAIMEQSGKKMLVTIESPEKARFTLGPATPMKSSPTITGQQQNKGVQKLIVNIPETKEALVQVRFTPH